MYFFIFFFVHVDYEAVDSVWEEYDEQPQAKKDEQPQAKKDEQSQAKKDEQPQAKKDVDDYQCGRPLGRSTPVPELSDVVKQLREKTGEKRKPKRSPPRKSIPIQSGDEENWDDDNYPKFTPESTREKLAKINKNPEVVACYSQMQMAVDEEQQRKEKERKELEEKRKKERELKEEKFLKKLQMGHGAARGVRVEKMDTSTAVCSSALLECTSSPMSVTASSASVCVSSTSSATASKKVTFEFGATDVRLKDPEWVAQLQKTEVKAAKPCLATTPPACVSSTSIATASKKVTHEFAASDFRMKSTDWVTVEGKLVRKSEQAKLKTNVKPAKQHQARRPPNTIGQMATRFNAPENRIPVSRNQNVSKGISYAQATASKPITKEGNFPSLPAPSSEMIAWGSATKPKRTAPPATSASASASKPKRLTPPATSVSAPTSKPIGVTLPPASSPKPKQLTPPATSASAPTSKPIGVTLPPASSTQPKRTSPPATSASASASNPKRLTPPATSVSAPTSKPIGVTLPPASSTKPKQLTPPATSASAPTSKPIGVTLPPASSTRPKQLTPPATSASTKGQEIQGKNCLFEITNETQ